MRVIRLGDRTSHGGEVITAADDYVIMDKKVALEDDICTCPIPGHGSGGIIGGDRFWTFKGRAVALQGPSVTHCGAEIYSSCGELDRTFEGEGEAGLGQGFSAANTSSTSSESMAGEISFDEQLQFLSESGKPYSNLDYKLILADGSNASGKTDATGKTERIVTDKATVISRAEFYPSALTCCARHAEESATNEPAQVVELQGVQTNPQDIGSSVVKITAEGESRPLTSGEIAMCKLIFKDAIDYSLVKVHNHEYLPFGWQNDDTAITPNGEIYFNPKHFKEDFSSDEVGFRSQLWFVHEMVHVWQKQLNYPVLTRGAVRIGLDYEYTLEKNKVLSDYNMEAQGNLLADYWALKQTSIPPSMYERKHRADLPLYEKVLRKFIQNPADKFNLPGGGNFDE